MILYQDGYLELDYDQSTDVLYALCPDIHKEDMLRLHKGFSVMVETIIHYDVKYFLFDASYSQTTVGEEEYFVVMEQLVQALRGTRLRKLARVVSSSPMREHRAARFIETSQDLFPYTIQNFTTKEAALRWLLSK